MDEIIPKVSIITTVRNGEKTLESMLDSVINQTYDNIELVVVDDGSIDSTLNILEKYEKKMDNLIIIKTLGIGRVPALNTAIERSTGEYIVNLDVDDLIHPQKIQIQINKMLNNPDYFLMATATIIVKDLNVVHWSKLENDTGNISEVTDYILIRNVINHSSVMMKKDILNKLGNYSINQKSQVDYELWLRAFLKNLKMGIIELPLTAKRIHSNQSFENKKRVQYTFRSMTLQQRYIFKTHKYKYSIFSVASFVLAQLPFNTRQKMSRRISRYIDGRNDKRF